MRILLDSNILYRALIEPEKLTRQVTLILSDSANYTAWVSSISMAEFRIKESVGKLRLPPSFHQEVLDLGYNILPFTFDHASRLQDLPLHHRDPFDRMLVAQALSEDLTLITSDKTLSFYPIKTLIN